MVSLSQKTIAAFLLLLCVAAFTACTPAPSVDYTTTRAQVVAALETSAPSYAGEAVFNRSTSGWWGSSASSYSANHSRMQVRVVDGVVLAVSGERTTGQAYADDVSTRLTLGEGGTICEQELVSRVACNVSALPSRPALTGPGFVCDTVVETRLDAGTPLAVCNGSVRALDTLRFTYSSNDATVAGEQEFPNGTPTCYVNVYAPKDNVFGSLPCATTPAIVPEREVATASCRYYGIADDASRLNEQCECTIPPTYDSVTNCQAVDPDRVVKQIILADVRELNWVVEQSNDTQCYVADGNGIANRLCFDASGLLISAQWGRHTDVPTERGNGYDDVVGSYEFTAVTAS